MTDNTRRPGLVISALAALAVSAFLVISACGSTDRSGMNMNGSGNATDAAFAADMIPHHRSAIEMATIAREQSERPEIRSMADDIISTQAYEIRRLQGIQKTLPESDGTPMGSVDMNVGALESAKPFDRMFIDMMVPHHANAVKMAQIELAKGENPELRRLAQAIVSAQTKEVGQMRGWRKDWYGSAGPDPIREPDGSPSMQGSGGSTNGADDMDMGG